VDGKSTVQRILLGSVLRRAAALRALEQLQRRKVVDIPLQPSDSTEL
jgi:hypothetical protein